jgi:hypothetical protein
MPQHRLADPGPQTSDEEWEMHARTIRHTAAFGAVAVLLMSATAAFADTVRPSTDGVVVDPAGNIDLGVVAPGAQVSVDLPFRLVCAGFSHLEPGNAAIVTFLSATVPASGVLGGVSSATVGPAPSGWPADGDACASPPQSTSVGTPSHVMFTAPTAPTPAGTRDSVLLMYSASSADGAISPAFVFVTLDMTVSADQPPTVQVPGPLMVEGNTTGGAIVTYVATATDPEDGDLTPVCSPPSGSTFPLGTTAVSCSASDSFGHTVTASFDVTVVDTTPPVLSGAPADLPLVTYDPAGAVVSYSAPSATDVVDPAPVVTCLPPPGSMLPVGATSVGCTATDASGNGVTATFQVAVIFIRLTASFEAPIGPSEVVAINARRTLPVKVSVERGGVPVTAGDVSLALESCAGSSLGQPLALSFHGDRWTVGLDTSGLAGCARGVVTLEGHVAGAFTIETQGALALLPDRQH